jgi:hypothetical protein
VPQLSAGDACCCCCDNAVAANVGAGAGVKGVELNTTDASDGPSESGSTSTSVWRSNLLSRGLRSGARVAVVAGAAAVGGTAGVGGGALAPCSGVLEVSLASRGRGPRVRRPAVAASAVGAAATGAAA